MKNLIIFILLLYSSNLAAQTYYNPRKTLDINITFKEPYKPVDYYGISSDFSKRISSESERRELLKKYYDQIIFDTKNSIQENLLLTADSEIDALIFKLNDITYKYLDNLNNLLKRGLLKPNEYEFKVKNIYYEHINSNKIIVSLYKYKFQRETIINDEEHLREFRSKFQKSISQIQGFKIDGKDKFEFLATGFYSKPKQIINLLDFVTSKL